VHPEKGKKKEVSDGHRGGGKTGRREGDARREREETRTHFQFCQVSSFPFILREEKKKSQRRWSMKEEGTSRRAREGEGDGDRRRGRERERKESKRTGRKRPQAG
jgi:hypothetical protein